MIPILWNHGREAGDVIGGADPNQMREEARGLAVEAYLDITDSQVAREAWRSVRRNRMSLSFGYWVERERQGADGAKELTALDLVEITLTTSPANSATRILEAKDSAGLITVVGRDGREQVVPADQLQWWEEDQLKTAMGYSSAQPEEEQLAIRPPLPVMLRLESDGTFSGEPIVADEDLSPGIDPRTMQLMPTPAEVKAAKKLEADLQKRRETRERERREAEEAERNRPAPSPPPGLFGGAQNP